MAATPFWLRAARRWFSRARVHRPAPRPRLWLEQLGERTLLSGLHGGYGPDFLSDHASRDRDPAAEAVRIGPAMLVDFAPAAPRGLAKGLAEHAATDLLSDSPASGPEAAPRGLAKGLLKQAAADFLASPPSDPLTHTGANDPGDGGSGAGKASRVSHAGGQHKTSSSGSLERMSIADVSLPEAADQAAQLQQLLLTVGVNDVEGRGAANLGGAAKAEEEYARYVFQEHPLSDQGLLAFLLRSRAEDEPGDRHAAGEGGRAFGAAFGAEGRADAAGPETVPAEKADGAAIARSLAAAFREEGPGENAGEEMTGVVAPALLVSCDEGLPPPRAELLPLGDGNRVLVAALVAGAPTDGPQVASELPSNADDALTGSPVGLDGGVRESDLGPVPVGAEGDPAASPLPGLEVSGPAAEYVPCDGALGHPAGDIRPAEAGPATRWLLLDAVFAAGVFHLWRHAGAPARPRDGRRPA
jgi:hypothetical protein